MTVLDASCLYEVLVGGPGSNAIRQRLSAEDELEAPHIIDVEVFGVIRRDHQRGILDLTGAIWAITALRQWPGERFGHEALLPRAWQLRQSVRGWDAMYVALAEALDVVLLTMDRRLARAHGPTCVIEVVGT